MSVSKLNSSLSEYPELMQSLLISKGIKTKEEAEDFLTIDYSKVHDPMLLKDMDKALERITLAIKQCFDGTLRPNQILIFSDYDHDGVPGAVIFYDFFKKIGLAGVTDSLGNMLPEKNVRVYIPHRHHEGFGLNLEAIDSFSKEEVKLMITIDCGITDVEEVARAKKLGIDVIITDHHMTPDVLPEAFAIINPKQKDCAYPEKMLCGSGVIYKVVQALLFYKPLRDLLETKDIKITEGWEKWLLDMVGIATLSDMVPLVGENRIFAHYGLRVLRKSPRLGLGALLRKLKIDQRYLSEDDIGFMISPRINAASRMGIPYDAFRLLSTENVVEAGALADHLDKINSERKGKVAALSKEIKKVLNEKFGIVEGGQSYNTKNNSEDESKDESSNIPDVIVFGNPNWSPALLGLVAGNIVEQYDRPVFLWGRDGDDMTVLKGSCRSNDRASVVEIMKMASEENIGMFKDFGGHSAAGGFSIFSEKIHNISEALNSSFLNIVDIESKKNDKDKSENNKENKKFDREISVDDVNWQNYSIVEKMAPYGTGNPKPVFLIRDIFAEEIKLFGKEKNHLEILMKNTAGKKVSAIGFFMDIGNLKKDTKIDLLCTMEKSHFRNFPELRLRIVGMI